MKLSKALLALAASSVVAIIVLQFGIPKMAQQGIALGCTPLTDSGETDPSDTIAIWENHMVEPALALNTNLSPQDQKVLGATAETKRIDVNLTTQMLTAYEGDKIFLTSLISSGLWNKTPVGQYEIWYKIVSTKMEGGIKGQRSYYYLPNVPFDMFFNGDIGIHGAYWHNNFGQPMSHGCVNTPTPVAEQLFYWSDPQIPEGKKAVRSSPENPGTKVIVHY